MHPDFPALGAKAAEVLDEWVKTYAAIQSVGVSPDAAGANIAGATVSDVNDRLTSGLSVAVRLQGTDESRAALLSHRFASISAAVDAIEAQSNAIRAALEPLHGASAVDGNGHLQLQLNHPEKGASTYDLGAALAAALKSSNTLVNELPFVSHALGEAAAPVFAGLVQDASEHIRKVKEAALESARELALGKGSVAELAALSKNATDLVKQFQEVLATSTAQKNTVDSNAAEVEQKLARAREISKDADTLQQRVTGFSSQFEAFETQMKARLEQFVEFEAATKEAQRINREQEARIAELCDRADTMIRGATVAGLSKSLEDTKNLYERRLQTTQNYFLFSVAALLICALPIAAQLIPGPWQQYLAQQANGAVSDTGPWLSALGKVVLLLPATWATAFFASNYAELFHLSREYAHKAALAKAIDGFKREAPEYAQEIVGSVFIGIQENPGSRKAPAPATPQNPVTKTFLEKVLEAVKPARGEK